MIVPWVMRKLVWRENLLWWLGVLVMHLERVQVLELMLVLLVHVGIHLRVEAVEGAERMTSMHSASRVGHRKRST